MEDNHAFLFLAYVLDIQCNPLLCSHQYNVFQYFRETLFLSLIGKNIQICRIPGVPIIIRYSFDSNSLSRMTIKSPISVNLAHLQIRISLCPSDSCSRSFRQVNDFRFIIPCSSINIMICAYSTVELVTNCW